MSPDRPPRPAVPLAALSGLLTAAVVLRAPRFTESLWYDEIAAWATHGTLGPGGIVGSFTEPSNHILHTLLSWCSVRLLEPAIGFELALRLPALVFSVLAVWATWSLATECLSRRGAVIAGALMAGLPVAILEGVEARGYSMMIFFSAVASRLLLVNLRDERAWRWVLYAVACALGTWAHFVTAFVPIGHAAWLAWRALREGSWRLTVRGWAAAGLAAAVTIALYAPALADLLAHRTMYTASRGDEPEILGIEGWHTLLQLGGSWAWWAAAPGLVLAGIGLASARGNPRLADAAWATLLGLPVFIAVVAIAGSWTYARFSLFSLPGAVLVMAAGIDALWTRHRLLGIGAAALLVISSASDLLTRPPKQPLRDAADDVREHMLPGDTILVVGIAHHVMDLYLADLEPAWSPMHGIDLPAQLERRPTWIIILYPRRVSPEHRALLAGLGYSLWRRFDGWVDWGAGDVEVWHRDGR